MVSLTTFYLWCSYTGINYFAYQIDMELSSFIVFERVFLIYQTQCSFFVFLFFAFVDSASVQMPCQSAHNLHRVICPINHHVSWLTLPKDEQEQKKKIIFYLLRQKKKLAKTLKDQVSDRLLCDMLLLETFAHYTSVQESLSINTLKNHRRKYIHVVVNIMEIKLTTRATGNLSSQIKTCCKQIVNEQELVPHLICRGKESELLDNSIYQTA